MRTRSEHKQSQFANRKAIRTSATITVRARREKAIGTTARTRVLVSGIRQKKVTTVRSS